MTKKKRRGEAASDNCQTCRPSFMVDFLVLRVIGHEPLSHGNQSAIQKDALRLLLLESEDRLAWFDFSCE